LWVAASDLPTTAAHPFYQRVNALLDEHYFDAFVEGLCRPFYDRAIGRPGLAPGIYFRLLLVGGRADGASVSATAASAARVGGDRPSNGA